MSRENAEPPTADASNLELLSNYTDAALMFCANIEDPRGNFTKQLMEVDAAVCDKFVLFLNKPWRMDRDQGFNVGTLSDGISHVRGMVLDGEAQLEALRRQTRGAFITLGQFVATSGALVPEHFPDAYDILRGATDRLDPRPGFTDFAFKRIRADLYTQYSMSRRGADFRALEPDILQPNIRAAWEVIGYPCGKLGEMAIQLGRLSPLTG